MKLSQILISVALVVSGCAPIQVTTVLPTVGQKEPIYPPYCWLQPTGASLWYPCGSEEALDKACLNLMELAMKAFEEDLNASHPIDSKLSDRVQESTIKLWNRAKATCWSDLKDSQEKHYH